MIKKELSFALLYCVLCLVIAFLGKDFSVWILFLTPFYLMLIGQCANLIKEKLYFSSLIAVCLVLFAHPILPSMSKENLVLIVLALLALKIFDLIYSSISDLNSKKLIILCVSNFSQFVAYNKILYVWHKEHKELIKYSLIGYFLLNLIMIIYTNFFKTKKSQTDSSKEELFCLVSDLGKDFEIMFFIHAPQFMKSMFAEIKAYLTIQYEKSLSLNFEIKVILLLMCFFLTVLGLTTYEAQF